MTTPIRVQHELDNALLDVQNIVNEYGCDIKMIFGEETAQTRDIYNSIKKRGGINTYLLKAWPVVYNPTVQQIEKCGIREQCDCIIGLARKDFIDAGIDYKTLELIRITIEIDGLSYRIKELGKESTFGGMFLYINFGLAKI